MIRQRRNESTELLIRLNDFVRIEVADSKGSLGCVHGDCLDCGGDGSQPGVVPLYGDGRRLGVTHTRSMAYRATSP